MSVKTRLFRKYTGRSGYESDRYQDLYGGLLQNELVFLKVYTDEGPDGVGEATLEYKEKALIGAVEHIRE